MFYCVNETRNVFFFFSFSLDPADKRSLFGLGRRRCLGEILARSEIFLFTSRLVQVFRLEVDPRDRANLEKDMTPGAPGTPHPFRFKLVERF